MGDPGAQWAQETYPPVAGIAAAHLLWVREFGADGRSQAGQGSIPTGVVSGRGEAPQDPTGKLRSACAQPHTCHSTNGRAGATSQEGAGRQQLPSLCASTTKHRCGLFLMVTAAWL